MIITILLRLMFVVRQVYKCDACCFVSFVVKLLCTFLFCEVKLYWWWAKGPCKFAYGFGCCYGFIQCWICVWSSRSQLFLCAFFATSNPIKRRFRSCDLFKLPTTNKDGGVTLHINFQLSSMSPIICCYEVFFIIYSMCSDQTNANMIKQTNFYCFSIFFSIIYLIKTKIIECDM